MKKKRNEVIIIRNRGGKLVEVRIVPHSRSQEQVRFSSDNVVEGSMETKPIPPRFDNLVEWLDRSGKIDELGKMLKAIFQ